MVMEEKASACTSLFTQFLLPMNPIELEWQHLKKDELCGQIFDDELPNKYRLYDVFSLFPLHVRVACTAAHKPQQLTHISLGFTFNFITVPYADYDIHSH